MGSQKVGYDCVTEHTHTHTHMHYVIISRPGKKCDRTDIILSYSKCGLRPAALASLKGLALPFHNLCFSQDPSARYTHQSLMRGQYRGNF